VREPRHSRGLWEDTNLPSQILPVHWEAASWPPSLPYLSPVAHIAQILRTASPIVLSIRSAVRTAVKKPVVRDRYARDTGASENLSVEQSTPTSSDCPKCVAQLVVFYTL